MVTKSEDRKGMSLPVVEIHVAADGISAAASGPSDSRLSPEQIAAIQQTLMSLVSGFRPPSVDADKGKGGLQLGSLELELGFKLETGAGTVLKLLLNATAEASIKAKVVWGQPM
jgi:hypothetical protein